VGGICVERVRMDPAKRLFELRLLYSCDRESHGYRAGNSFAATGDQPPRSNHPSLKRGGLRALMLTTLPTVADLCSTRERAYSEPGGIAVDR
jgi:hypothetical protein